MIAGDDGGVVQEDVQWLVAKFAAEGGDGFWRTDVELVFVFCFEGVHSGTDSTTRGVDFVALYLMSAYVIEYEIDIAVL